jgi:hypothetical protein
MKVGCFPCEAAFFILMHSSFTGIHSSCPSCYAAEKVLLIFAAQLHQETALKTKIVKEKKI